MNYVEKDLTAANTFADQSIETEGFVPAPNGFSMGDLCGRHPIHANRARVVLEVPNDQTRAENVEPGNEATATNIVDYLRTIKTDTAEKLNFSNVLAYSHGIVQDEPQVINAALDNAHRRHMVNAENYHAFNALMNAKPVTILDAFHLDWAINAYLSATSKKSAAIYTNKAGFAVLDNEDSCGNPIIHRNETGSFIYRSKYGVNELNNGCFPETDAAGCLNVDPALFGGEPGHKYAPVFVGDMAAVLRFFPIREANAQNFDFMTDYDRTIREEIITLTTTDDEVWFWGVVDCTDYYNPDYVPFKAERHAL